MLASADNVQADALQPDPAWQQGTLANGLQRQVLATPQRPSDRIEVRLQVNTGSRTESTQQGGFSHAIPRIALTQSGGLDAAQARSLWQQGFDPKRPMPPVIVSYDSTLYNLSLPNNRNDLLKEALTYLANVSGK
ncbi:insulinase family protein, partial [Leptospira interrogans serovar Pomona]|nr:insulinase family protein [Leptospira interrogans serovar Pomona]